MQDSQKSNMLSEEDLMAAVIGQELAESYLGTDDIVGQLVAQIDKMVAVFGDHELALGFDSRQFVTHWLDSYVPALGGKPSRLLGTKEGRAHVQNVLNCSWSGAYA